MHLFKAIVVLYLTSHLFHANYNAEENKHRSDKKSTGENVLNQLISYEQIVGEF